MDYTRIKRDKVRGGKNNKIKKNKHYKKKKKQELRQIAEMHINELFDFAEKIQKVSQEFANNAIKTALRIAHHYKIRLDKEKKYRICKKCGSFLTPGRNSETILKNSTIIIKCLQCGYEKRWPYTKEKKKKQNKQ